MTQTQPTGKCCILSMQYMTFTKLKCYVGNCCFESSSMRMVQVFYMIAFVDVCRSRINLLHVKLLRCFVSLWGRRSYEHYIIVSGVKQFRLFHSRPDLRFYHRLGKGAKRYCRCFIKCKKPRRLLLLPPLYADALSFFH